jgi:hypothetical protein
MHPLNRAFKPAYVNLFNDKVPLSAFFLQIALYDLVSLASLLPLGFYCLVLGLNEIFIVNKLTFLLYTISTLTTYLVFLKQHGQTAFYTKAMTDWINSEQKGNY